MTAAEVVVVSWTTSGYSPPSRGNVHPEVQKDRLPPSAKGILAEVCRSTIVRDYRTTQYRVILSI